MKEQGFYNYEIMCLFSGPKIKLEKESQVNWLNQLLKDQKNSNETIEKLQKQLNAIQSSYARVKKEELIEKIQNLVPIEKKELEKNKLVWPVEIENYLLFQVKSTPKQIQQIEKIIQQSLVQYLLINLDKEKKIKLRKVKLTISKPEEIASK